MNVYECVCVCCTPRARYTGTSSRIYSLLFPQLDPEMMSGQSAVTSSNSSGFLAVVFGFIWGLRDSGIHISLYIYIKIESMHCKCMHLPWNPNEIPMDSPWTGNDFLPASLQVPARTGISVRFETGADAHRS